MMRLIGLVFVFSSMIFSVKADDLASRLQAKIYAIKEYSRIRSFDTANYAIQEPEGEIATAFKRWQEYLNQKLCSQVLTRQVPQDMKLFLDNMFERGWEAFLAASLSGANLSAETMEEVPFMSMLPLGERRAVGVYKLPAPYDSWLCFMSSNRVMKSIKAGESTRSASSEALAESLRMAASFLFPSILKNVSRPFVHERLRQEVELEQYVPMAYFYHLPWQPQDVSDANYAVCINTAVHFAPQALTEEEAQKVEFVFRECWNNLAISSSMFVPLEGLVVDAYSQSFLLDLLGIPSLSGSVNMLLPSTTVILALPQEFELPECAISVMNFPLICEYFYKDELAELMQKLNLIQSMCDDEVLADPNAQQFFKGLVRYRDLFLTGTALAYCNNAELALFGECLSMSDDQIALNVEQDKKDARIILERDNLSSSLLEKMHAILSSFIDFRADAFRLYRLVHAKLSCENVFNALMQKRPWLRTFKPVQGFGGGTNEALMMMELVASLQGAGTA